MIIDRVRQLGKLAPGLKPAAAIDILWIYNDPAHYAALVSQRGWSERAFRQWLARTMKSALLPN
jgi:hypothetical protein